ncbi:MAG: hypothetical protein AVDCRST_MAG56-2289 [uncultured Cytophagales bacterium]|uniref:Uncharacterized protein n=1 Tax=uncultured Cytophagales bacterium TaxID=158755 RepID=A0A6J4IQW4_9SPHI|nr:MAG: hypothetical protein AVDCRST_MAG56-2289 [uncultured Cytophagales bacterium]
MTHLRPVSPLKGAYRFAFLYFPPYLHPPGTPLRVCFL